MLSINRISNAKIQFWDKKFKLITILKNLSIEFSELLNFLVF